MLIFISLLLLAHWIMGRDVSRDLDRFRKLDWKKNLNDLWSRIRPYAKKMGRTASRPILQFYYVLNDRNTSALDRALIYGALIYVLFPVDILPKAVYRIIGVIDDGMAILYVYNKIKDRITPDINLKVEMTLDEWFGVVYEVQ